MPEEMKKAVEEAGRKAGGPVQSVPLSAQDGKGGGTSSGAGGPAGAGAAGGKGEGGGATASSTSAPEVKLEFATKGEAKEAFKELLASVNTGSDWTWEQTMRLIVNDPRWGGGWGSHSGRRGYRTRRVAWGGRQNASI